MNEKSNKLVSLLSSLEKAQRRSCRKLVRSSWFGGNDDLGDLFDELGQRLEKGKTLDKRTLWRAVFGSERPFSDVRFRKYTSDLFKLIKEYLVQETLNREPHLRRYLYLVALEKQHPDKLVRSIERNWRPPENSRRFDATSFLYEHLLELRKYHLLNYSHRPYAQSNVEELSRALDIYFISTKLIHAAHTQSRLQTEQQQFSLKLADELIDFLDSDNSYLQEPLVALYYYMYKMLIRDEGNETYYHYKDHLKAYSDEFGAERGYEFFQPALNFCRRRINEGVQDFLGEYMELYKSGLERGYVFDDDILDPLQFRNTILIALRQGEYDWTEAYIRDYQDKLPPKQRSNAVTYNLATLYFYQKNWDKALEFLRDVEFENTTINLNTKAMMLAIYYETGAYDALDSLFDAINAYINRHKELPDSAKKAFGNLASLTLRLTRMLPGDNRALQNLKADLATKRYVASRPWLMKKMDEYEQKSSR